MPLLAKNAYNRQWRKDNPERRKEINRKSYNKNSEKTRYYRLKCNAKYRRHTFTLTQEEYKGLISQPCFYCGGELPKHGSGLDRTNSNFGYTPDNVRPCCTQCNLSKNDYTEEEFKEWSIRLFNNFGGVKG